MIGFGIIGIGGFLGVVAMAADEATFVRETFIETAERFGIFAAFTVGFTVLSVGGLICMVYYVIVTQQQMIDDNTTAMLRLNSTLKQRPCLHDSDIERIEHGTGSNSDDEISKRVIDRRRERKARREGTQ